MVINSFIPGAYFDVPMWPIGRAKSKKYLCLMHDEKRAAIFERVQLGNYRHLDDVTPATLYILPGFLQMYVQNAWKKWGV